MTRSKSYQEDLIKALEDPLEAQEYLNAALKDKDLEVFLLALRDVAQARSSSMKQLAEVTKLNRENLYRMLSDKGNTELKSLSAILDALGFRLTVELIR
jgi:probable addiction module antidote protein